MSFFNGTAHVIHSSKLPTKATREQAVAMLHDHIFLLQCDPHLESYKALNPITPAAIPDTVRPLRPTKSYSVTDIVHTIPAGLWDSKVVSTYEITDTADGLFVRILSPLSIVMDTIWAIRDAEDGDGLELYENIEIRCSRLLVGVVKSQCEGGWQHIHGKMIGRLEEEIATRAEEKDKGSA
ncbi:hypothetical protein V8F20_003072 [Naviculisporaceae sp. PSN 640]